MPLNTDEIKENFRRALLDYRDRFGLVQTQALLLHLFAECEELKKNSVARN
jgi:hypothetical protein